MVLRGSINDIPDDTTAFPPPQAARLLGTDDPQAIQFVFSMIDGLLLGQIDGQTIDWPAQAAIVSILETLINADR
jgi:hypothetical protein